MLARILLLATLGFVVGVVAGYLLVATLSSNTHDRSVEAAMSAFFFFGPAGAVVGAVVGYFRRPRSSS